MVLGGCLGETNPCPVGLRPDREADRCVPPDAGADAPAPRTCSTADVAAWAEAIQAPGLVERIGGCAAWCATASACLADCLADAAGVIQCGECVQGAVVCAGLRCRAACSSGTDHECRACQCEAGCVHDFDICAGGNVSAEVCRDVHGVPASDFTVPKPIVLRRKSETGYTRTTTFAAEGLEPATRVTYAASGWTDFLAFSLGGVEYVLEHMGGCDEPRCPTRISPITANGALGRPAWNAEWSTGYDVLTWFPMGEGAYLVSYASGARPAAMAVPGDLDIYRIRAGDPSPAIEVELLHHGEWLTEAGHPWTHLEAFAVDDRGYLLRARAGENTDADVVRVVEADGALGFARVASDLGWDAGWDLVQTFPAAERWFVLRYTRDGTATMPAGTVLVSAFVTEAGGRVAIGPAVIADTWTGRIDEVHPLRTPAQAVLVRVEQRIGRADFLALPADSAAWPRDALPVLYTERWGTIPPWDVVTVLRARLWEEP